MSFEHLIEKVTQAEHALEARERSVEANLRQVKASWHSAWTPGRIVVAGFASGFLVGHGKLLSKLGGSNVLQLASAFAGLIASGAQGNPASDPMREMLDRFRPQAANGKEESASNNETLRQHHEQLRRDGLV